MSFDDEQKGFNYKHLFEAMMNEFDTVLYVDETLHVASFVKTGRLFGFIGEMKNDLPKAFEEFKSRIYPEDVRLIEAFNPAKDKRFFAEMRFKSRNDDYVWGFVRLAVIKPRAYFVMLADLSGSVNREMQKKTDNFNKMMSLETELSILQQKYKSLKDHADVMVFEYDLATKYISIESNLQNRFTFAAGYCEHINNFMRSDIIFYPDRDVLRSVADRLGSVETVHYDLRLRGDNGDYFRCNAYFYGIYSPDGKLLKITGTVKDNESPNLITIPETGKDKLTGLLDVDSFYTRIDIMLKDHPTKKYAVIVFDVFSFKYIDQLHGTDFADNALKFIAFYMKSNFESDNCFCARFWGDHFGILTELTGNDDGDEQIFDMINRLSKEAGCYKTALLRYSFGVYKINSRLVPPRIICDCADIAKRTVKGNHLENVAIYSEDMRKRILDDIIIENDMEEALEKGQFSMYLQPKYNIATGDAVGAEALVRWFHPVRGMIRPDSFIPLFEKNGFIIKLDRYIWEQACRLIVKWQSKGIQPIPVSVNVSRVNLRDRNIVSVLDKLIADYGIEKKYLELEITETVYYDDQPSLMEVLKNLKTAGYRLLMDDFGSGFSSLSMLKSTPFDVLKIDRQFLNESMMDDKGKKIIMHAISMANDIGLDIVAEGVETREQADYLLECGCPTAQGYYYSKPVSVEKFELVTGMMQKEQ